jgi:hypothetical protein
MTGRLPSRKVVPRGEAAVTGTAAPSREAVVKTLSKIAVAPSLAAGLLTAGATAAHASNYDGTYGGYAGSGVYIRSGPSTGYRAYGQGQGSQTACLYYYVTGQDINGDPYWVYNKDLVTGVTGYSATYYMYSLASEC